MKQHHHKLIKQQKTVLLQFAWLLSHWVSVYPWQRFSTVSLHSCSDLMSLTVLHLFSCRFLQTFSNRTEHFRSVTVWHSCSVLLDPVSSHVPLLAATSRMSVCLLVRLLVTTMKLSFWQDERCGLAFIVGFTLFCRFGMAGIFGLVWFGWKDKIQPL